MSDRGSTSNADILWQASIDDRTIEFFQRFDANLDRLASASEQSFSGVDASIKKSGKEAGILAGVFAGLTTAVVSFGLQALGSIKSFLEGSVQLRARVDTLGITLNQIGQRAGYSSDQIKQFEEDIKSMGITTQAARNTMLRLIRANIDLAEASKLARIAQDAAVVAGINSSEAFERLILGIQKQEPELLDELGITLKRTDAYASFAAQVGKTTKELTQAEKQQAILNDIYKQSEVVAGSYDAAMGSVGKQVTSLPRHIEELQLALGNVFQPAYQAQIEFYTEQLKNLRKWVDDNKEGLQRLAVGLGTAAQQLFKWFSQLIQFLSTVPDKLKTASEAIATIVGRLAGLDDTEIEKRVSGMGQAFAQLITIVATSMSVGVQMVISVVEFAANKITELLKVVKGEMTLEEVRASTDEFARTFRTQIEETARSTFESVGIMTGALEDTGEAAEEAADQAVPAMEEIEEAVEDVSGTIKQVDDAFKALQKRLERQAEDDYIQELRRQTEAALQESFRMEDIERQHQERLTDIREQYEKRRADLQTDYDETLLNVHEDSAERRLQIEEDYRKRLADLQRDYEYRASELARARDAIGLVRLMEEHRRAIDAEKRNRDERKEDEQKSLDDRLKSIKEAFARQNQEIETQLSEQLKAAEEARQKELDDYQRNLDRQRQIRELHNQWEEEDRQRALAREFEDMAEHFAEMEDLTQEHLDGILEKWEEHFGDLSGIMEDFIALRAEMEEAAAAASGSLIPSTTGVGSSGGYRGRGRGRSRSSSSADSDPTRDDGVNRPGRGGRGGTTNPSTGTYIPPMPTSSPIGQMGQISQTLANMSAQPSMYRTPPVPAQSRNDYMRKEIHVTAEGLEPIIQRQLVAALTEIERNRQS